MMNFRCNVSNNQIYYFHVRALVAGKYPPYVGPLRRGKKILSMFIMK